jgi:hypothetical protein
LQGEGSPDEAVFQKLLPVFGGNLACLEVDFRKTSDGIDASRAVEVSTLLNSDEYRR